jgi:GDP-D-mannose dehydratase
MQVNVEGTLNILEAVKDLGAKGTRIFNAGSSTVYGKTADEWDGPIPEHAPLQPVTPCKASSRSHAPFRLESLPI